MRRVFLSLSATIVAAASASCKPLCAPGSTQACVCTTGGSGAQACAANGETWELCACAPTPPLPEGSSPSAEPTKSAEPTPIMAAAPDPKSSRVVVGTPRIRGVVSGVREVVEAQVLDLQLCHVNALARDPSVEGRTSIKFIITPDGWVQVAVEEVGGSLDDPRMGSCLSTAIQRWTFSKPRRCGKADGCIAVVELPLEFRRQE